MEEFTKRKLESTAPLTVKTLSIFLKDFVEQGDFDGLVYLLRDAESGDIHMGWSNLRATEVLGMMEYGKFLLYGHTALEG